MPRRRLILVAVAVTVALFSALLLIRLRLGQFDAESFKPRIEAAVQRATGRALVLGGPLRFDLSLVPRVTADRVALANIPGGSRPQMLTVARLEAQIALLPLLRRRVVVQSLTLIHPDIVLERNGAGVGNWVFHPQPRPVRPAGAAGSAGGRTRFALAAFHIRDGRVTWVGGGPPRSFGISQLDATMAGPAGPVSLAFRASTAGLLLDGSLVAGPMRIAPPRSGQAGESPPAGQVGASPPTGQAGASWPVSLRLQSSGATAAATGVLDDPAGGGGFDLRIGGRMADLHELQPLMPETALPPLHDLAVAARVQEGASGPASVRDLWVRVGKSALGPPDLLAMIGTPAATVSRFGLRGLLVDAATLNLPVWGGPAQMALRGAIIGSGGPVPVQLQGTLGRVPVPPGAATVPLTLSAALADNRFLASGTAPLRLGEAGTDLALQARIADLAALAPLAGKPLPPLRAIDLRGHLRNLQNGGLGLDGLRLAAPFGDLAGSLTLGWAPEIALGGALVSRRFDLDRLRADLAQAAAPAPAPAPPNPGSGTPEAGSTGPRPATSLPWQRLRGPEMDLTLTAAELRAWGGEYRDVTAQGRLHQGVLRVESAATAAGAAPAHARLAVDATAAVPSLALSLKAPAIDAAGVAAAAGAAGELRGVLAVDADLTSAGTAWQGLEAALSGHLGVSIVNGAVANRLLLTLAGPAARAAAIPLPPQGESPLRCLALRADFVHGLGDISALAVDAGRLRMSGSGSVDLRQQLLDLHLRPVLQLGGTEAAVPLRLTGPFRAPRAMLDRIAQGRVGFTIGAALDGGGDVCAAPLASARAGMPGTPAAAPPPSPKRKFPKPADLLRQLFR